MSPGLWRVVSIIVTIAVLIVGYHLVLRLLQRPVAAVSQRHPDVRSRTLGSLLTNLVRWIVAFVVVVLVLRELGVDVQALVVSAGVLGIVVGLGAQALIRDLITGVFLLFEGLLGVGDGKQLWAGQLDEKFTDVFTVQDLISEKVVSALALKLTGEEQRRLTKHYTENVEAYQLYLKGNFYHSKYTEEGFKKSIEYYEKAIALDPNYALAYHGIAAAYDFANGFYLSPKETEPKAKAAALRALELDETLAETHYLLGKILFWYEWDWATAERHWKRANELDPTYPADYPVYLAATGRFDEAVKATESRAKARTNPRQPKIG